MLQTPGKENCRKSQINENLNKKIPKKGNVSSNINSDTSCQLKTDFITIFCIMKLRKIETCKSIPFYLNRCLCLETFIDILLHYSPTPFHLHLRRGYYHRISIDKISDENLFKSFIFPNLCQLILTLYFS